MVDKRVHGHGIMVFCWGEGVWGSNEGFVTWMGTSSYSYNLRNEEPGV